MKIITQTSLTDSRKQRALSIWNAEYPVKLCMPGTTEFDDFLNTLVNPVHYLLINNADETIGWAATFLVENVRCFFIMIDGSMHGRGYGTMLLNELKSTGDQLFGWAIDHSNDRKADGKPYLSPLNFYRKNNFVINPEIRLETEQLSAVNIVWDAGAGEA